MYEHLNIGDIVYLLPKSVNSNNYINSIKKGNILETNKKFLKIQVIENEKNTCSIFFSEGSYISDIDGIGIVYELFFNEVKAKEVLAKRLSTDNLRREVSKFVFSATASQLEDIYTYFLREGEKL